MSRVDATFGSIPGPLLRSWGQTVRFHKAGSTSSYNPNTGAITSAPTTYTAKAVVTRLKAEELSGTLQSSDYKVLIAPSEIGGNYITTADSFTFTRGNKSINGKVVDVTTLAGDSPLMFTAIVRPQ